MRSRLPALAVLVLAAAAVTSCSGGSSSADAGALRQIEVPTEGMAPTIRPGQVVTVDPHAYDDGAFPEVGDIVLFDPTVPASRTCGVGPLGPLPFVQRVVGIPGDRVDVNVKGETLRNGVPLEVDDAIRPNYTMRFPVVPQGSVLVLGDNRPGSCDSHQWRRADGRPAPFVPVGNLLGKIVL